MSIFYTTKEIAVAVGLTERAIQKQAHDWKRTKKPVGKGFLYPLEGLPEDVQQKMLLIYKDNDNETRTAPIDVLADPVPIPKDLVESIGVDSADPVELPTAISSEVSQTASDAPVLDVVNSDSPKSEGKKTKRPRKENPTKVAAWQAILAAQDAWCRDAGHRLRVVGDEAFVVAYNKKEIEGISPEIYELIPNISRATIARKRQGAEEKQKSGRPKA